MEYFKIKIMVYNKLLFLLILFLAVGVPKKHYGSFHSEKYPTDSLNTAVYNNMKQQYISGWNTWNTRSIASFVHMPESFSLNIGLKDHSGGWVLHDPLIGIDNVEGVHKARSADGSYTNLDLEWYGYKINVQSAKTNEGEMVILVKLLENNHLRVPSLLVGGSVLWNRPGYAEIKDNKLQAQLDSGEKNVFITGETSFEPYAYTHFPALATPLDNEVGISTGNKLTLSEIKKIIRNASSKMDSHFYSFGDAAKVAEIASSMFGWLTVYDPSKNRILTPDSRRWNYWNGGYAIFVWEMYPLGYTAAALGLKEIAYSNIIEQTNEILPNGMMPNYATPGFIAKDRSMPPVGALCVWETYKKFEDSWLLEEVFPNLLRWNTWWLENRLYEGLLCYGSNSYEPVTGNEWEKKGVNERFGAALESGLDNSPMYDNVPFDKERSILKLWDVGLNSLYVADCHYLALIAEQLGDSASAKILKERKQKHIQNMQKLFDKTEEVFKNKRWDTGEFQQVISPTVFYPFIAGLYTQQQAEKVIEKYFFNPDYFWGEWIMPSTAKNHPAFKEQNYWRGRVWSALNFYTYLGFKNYNLPEATKALVEKSALLLEKNWDEKNHIYENYNALTGTSGDKSSNSDPFYNWGVLLGTPKLIENGYINPPSIFSNE